MTNAPGIRYTKSSDGTNLAYWEIGAGPTLVMADSMVSEIQAEWEAPGMRAFYERLAEGMRVVRFDFRGRGLSGRAPDRYSCEHLVDDLRAIVEATGSGSVFLFGGACTTGPIVLFADRYPQLCSGVALFHPVPRGSDWSRLPQTEALAQASAVDPNIAGTARAAMMGNSRAEFEQIQAVLRRHRERQDETCIAPSREFDVNDELDRLSIPVLVLTRTATERGTHAFAPDVAAQAPNSRLVILPGAETSPFVNSRVILDELYRFVTGDGRPRVTARSRQTTPRGFSTILFTDVVSSTPLLSQLRDQRMREVMRDHDAVCEAAIAEHGGRVVKIIGDAFMAEFDLPSAAVDAAIAIQRGIEEQFAGSDVPIRLRIGINAGEPIVEDDDLHGASVVIAKRLESAAGTGEILVSDVVRQAVAGKDFEFKDRGEVELKGFDQPARAWAVRW